ncbi:MAG: hypothetical protein A3G75_00370 [Verrucomicrobia bacterium RIFCSPLOWO2_12_FULL_64_8]|nr:MAG: hypothetical protein A3G75_00370 [Verrucomicrobia bacterium RIFCSPLOWO2_12_FULL_64_8]
MRPYPMLRALPALLLFSSPARAHDAAAEMAVAANAFLAALTPEQRAKARFEFKDDERLNWHFVPRPRKGLPFKEMTRDQRLLAQALLASGLSPRAHMKAVTIMSLDEVLLQLEGPRSAGRRDPELYYLSIFGTPGSTGAWGWRVEGHHVAFNLTVVDGREVAGAPSFLGANPAEVREGPRRGLRALASEEDLGRALIESLTPAQRAKAVFTRQTPREIITGNERKVKALETVGIGYAGLNREQQAKLMELVTEYAGRLRSEFADRDLERIRAAGLDPIHFGWAGEIEKGGPHYYRVQGPTFLLEYDCVQNGANHIHAVWRDFENDFGEDILRKHYEQTPH